MIRELKLSIFNVQLSINFLIYKFSIDNLEIGH